MANDELMLLAAKWRSENGDYPEAKRDCAEELERALSQRAPQNGAVPEVKRAQDCADLDGVAAAHWANGWNACRTAMLAADLRALAQRAPQNGAVPEGCMLVRESMLRHWLRELNGIRNGNINPEDAAEHVHASIAAVLAAAPAPEARQPDGYAYRYAVGRGMTVIRMNGGIEVNGAMPIEAIPYFYGKPEPEAETLDESLKRTIREISDEITPEAERAEGEAVAEIIAADGGLNGKMLNWKRGLVPFIRDASIGTKLYTHPAPPPAGQPEGVEALHPSTIKWIQQEIETAEAFGDDDGEAEDQRRVIHLQRLLRFASRLTSAPKAVQTDGVDVLAIALAEEVRSALDRQACPDHYMRIAFEAVESGVIRRLSGAQQENDHA